MNRQSRISKISEIEEGDSWAKQEIMWKGSLVPMEVYQVPLDCLIYNKYNGRILSRTRSLEAHGEKLNPESETDKKIIEKLLWYSKPDRNRRTKEDIEKHGQQKVGIITRDGIVIDGNRRVMILNQIEKYRHFKAIILPVTSEQDPLEIEKLETSYQMGEDEKLGYNPIEKYLKTKGLLKQRVSKEEIASWMGESIKQINTYLEVMQTMDEYLDYLRYNDVFTQLDGREDHFINITKWTNAFYGGGSTKAFDGYKDGDVDDLKAIAFDYIRVKYEGKKFRLLGEGQRHSHFFGSKQIWESFRDTHYENITPIHRLEEDVNFDSSNIQATLNERDNSFAEKAKNILEDNLSEHEQKIYNQKHKDEPGKLITKSIDAVKVAQINKNIKEPEVLEKVARLNDITSSILYKSPEKVLKQILNLMSSIVIMGDEDEKETLLKHIKDIGRKAYQIEKQIKES